MPRPEHLHVIGGHLGNHLHVVAVNALPGRHRYLVTFVNQAQGPEKRVAMGSKYHVASLTGKRSLG